MWRYGSKKLFSWRFLRSDSQPMYGLQDWSTTDWQDALMMDDESARIFCADFVPEKDWSDKSSLAMAIREKIDKPLEGFHTLSIAEFQNKHMNRMRNMDKGAKTRYPHPSLLSNAIFNREFPLGMEEKCMQDVTFAVEFSGLGEISHERSIRTTIVVYSSMCGCLCGVIAYMVYICHKNDLWTMQATMQHRNTEEFVRKLNFRTRERGTFASLINAMFFSSTVNSTLDKFGRIDPSTSTVLIGMVLGGTWGFVLDCMFGSDEGFREYLWAPTEGLRYAFGSLSTARFARYLVTIIFDMFFTVILFKNMYPQMLRISGFSQRGREWIANAFVSGLIAVSTYQVYANMMRFEWAYPSGHEDVMNQWISGPTMIIATVIMNMVFLTTETRTRWGEPGINDPSMKLLVTICTFIYIAMLQMLGIMDPSGENLLVNATSARWTDWNMPLKGVCQTKARWLLGAGVFGIIVTFTLGFTIFVTSRLSRWMKIFMFVMYNILTVMIVGFFAFVPIFRHRGEARRDGEWVHACNTYDRGVLERFDLH